MGKYQIYQGKVGFARIKCMRCNLTNTADKWRCNCGFRWQKCQNHIVKAQATALDKVKGCAKGKIRGVKQLTKNTRTLEKSEHPIRRKATIPEIQTQVISDGGVRTHLEADHILAKRFPALYAKQVNNERQRNERRMSISDVGTLPPTSSGSGGQPPSPVEGG